MARSTYKTFLMHKASASADWTKLIDIKEFPDLGGDPEQIETTTLSDFQQTYIPGIQSLDGLSFTSNYTLDEFKKLKALEEKDLDLAIWFGGTGEGTTLVPTGSDGKFKFTGRLVVYVNGGGVNEVVNMTISVSPSTPIELDEDSGSGD